MAGMVALCLAGCDRSPTEAAPDPARDAVAARVEALAAGHPLGFESSWLLPYAARAVRLGLPAASASVDAGSGPETWHLVALRVDGAAGSSILVGWRDSTEVFVAVLPAQTQGRANEDGRFGQPTGYAAVLSGGGVWAASDGRATVHMASVGRKCPSWKDADEACNRATFDVQLVLSASPWGAWPSNSASGTRTVSVPPITIQGVWIGVPYVVAT
jgi:hypothetical protein